jgi:hypothetical protein
MQLNFLILQIQLLLTSEKNNFCSVSYIVPSKRPAVTSQTSDTSITCSGHQISHALFQVIWIVRAEYDDTAVPPLFRQFFQSGQALGAIRWLASLQKQCEYMAIFRSSHVASSIISGMS